MKALLVMDKFVVGGKNDEKLLEKMIKELGSEEPVTERAHKPNTAFLNRLLSNTERHNSKKDNNHRVEKGNREPRKTSGFGERTRKPNTAAFLKNSITNAQRLNSKRDTGKSSIKGRNMKPDEKVSKPVKKPNPKVEKNR